MKLLVRVVVRGDSGDKRPSLIDWGFRTENDSVLKCTADFQVDCFDC
jgi:hypothetical protein